MFRLHISTAGESHGAAEIAVLTGVPAGLGLVPADIDAQLVRRQSGYGRGGRQRIERDAVEVLAGVRRGRTTGAPIALLVRNRDHDNWLPTMSVEDVGEPDERPVLVPRPGHADLAGLIKYGFDDARDVLERSSARATVARVAAGAVARRFLDAVDVAIRGRVVSIGRVRSATQPDYRDPASIDWDFAQTSATGSDEPEADRLMQSEIDGARERGVSLGGTFEVWASGVAPGLGSYIRPEERLDGRLAGSVMAIPAIKGVEIGLGFGAAALTGEEVHDEIYAGPAGEEVSGGSAAEDEPAGGGSGWGTRIVRGSNNAGGTEGGVTTGLPVVIRAAMKPIPTMRAALDSVQLPALVPAEAHRERADVEAVSAARVVAEAEVCLVLADAYLQKFGGDSMDEAVGAFHRYRDAVKERGLWPS